MDTPAPHTPHQKVSLWVFVVIGMTTLVFGVLRLQKAIVLPFVRQPSNFSFKTSDEIDSERTAALKSSDTDRDSLNDYDELYVYHTSPFLADSDSDGTGDGDEVKANTDPNCPKGKVCRQVRSADQAAATDAAASAASNGDAPIAASVPASGGGTKEDSVLVITETFGDLTALTKESIAAKLAAMSAADVKSFLLRLGVPKLALDKSDDATLRAMTQQTLEQIADSVKKQAPAADGGAAAGTTTPSAAGGDAPSSGDTTSSGGTSSGD